ncbi:trehalase family glycosidase [bacterium]|nr:trehalase family glycosidase [bacterium]
MQNHTSDLIARAKEILYNNLRNGFTIPRDKLYPFQWNWDSGFVSLGFANFDIDAAISEINSLLKGQWENGMVPHIIFHSENETSYFPNWDFWDASVNPGAPQGPKTSGITQPPVLGFVLESILKKHPDNPKVLDFVRKAFPKIVKYHEFWYKHRDPNREGLVFIYHPWESGRDNSPLWDDSLNLINLEEKNIPDYQRQDITIADASERPTSVQYDQYVYLLQLGKKYRYEDKGIAENSEFLIQDSLINAMLIRSNEALINIGKRLGEDTGKIVEWQQQSISAYNEKLWSESLQTYTGYDLRQGKQLPFWEIGGMTALFAGIPTDKRAVQMKGYLETLIEKDYMIVPSFDVAHEFFDSKRYWRGPIWPQMNWLIYHGLKSYGFDPLAQTVKDDFLELVSRFGFHEYFESQKDLVATTHGGYGGNKFSWTASSVIDLIMCP